MNPIEQRAKATTLAAMLTPVAVGLIYVTGSCERYSPGPGKCESQWVTALAIGGMGGAWSAGFWQPNQALRQRERELMDQVPVPAGASPDPGDDPLMDQDHEMVMPEPMAVDAVYTDPELARLTVEDLRSVARLLGLRDLARHGRRTELVASLRGQPRVEGA